MRRLEPLWVLLGYAIASVVLIGRFWLRAPHDAVVGSFGGDQGFFACGMALGTSQAPRLCPTSIAVHDACHMARNEAEVHFGRD